MKKWNQLLLWFAGAILLAAALERFLVSTSHAQILALPEPMLGIPLRYAVLVVGVLELVGALVCLFVRRPALQLGCLAWLITNYAAYRMGLVSLGCHAQAACIGRLTDPLRLSGGMPGAIVAFIPACLALACCAVFVMLRFERRQIRASGFAKLFCPSCGGHVTFSLENLGQHIPCPHCQKIIPLRQPATLKMSCFFCHGHIEFPAHAIGEKMPCPHCKKDITLKEPA